MRRHIAATAMIGALLAAGTATPGAVTSTAAQPSGGKPAPALGTHSVRGLVKSVDPSTLVIARTGKRPADLTFVLRGSTIREGQIAVGRLVSIRYVMDGDTRIATAVSAQPDGLGRIADRPVTRTKGGS